MSRPAPFKQSHVTRAIKGAAAAGFTVDRVEIDADGRIVLVTGLAAPDGDQIKSNPWNEVLDGKKPHRPS